MRRILICLLLLLASVAPVASTASAADPVTQVVVAAAPWTYSPTPIHVPAGGALQFVNADGFAGEGHSITHVAGGKRPALFTSPIIPMGVAAEVMGVGLLPPGSYGFACQVHPFMAGTLIVD